MSEWNGEGIPPVGTVCEATWEEGCNPLKCVPIQSEEQRQVAEIDAIITSHDNTASPEIAQEIYNAGFRKVVE